MLPDTFMFSLVLLITGMILFLLMYYIMNLSDVECDHMNAQSCCNTLNFWVIPKIGAHGFIIVLLLLEQKYWLLLANVPVIAWEVYQLLSLRPGSMGVYDPTEIHSRGQVRKHLQNCMLCVAFYLMIFFVYLYFWINAILAGDPIRRHEEEEIVTEL